MPHNFNVLTFAPVNQNIEIMLKEERFETTWHLFLTELERHPRTCLAPFLRNRHVDRRGFERWMSRRGYSVCEAKGRILQLRMEAQSTGFAPVEVYNTTDSVALDLLSGVSLTLPDGTSVTIRRGSATAIVSFLKLYTMEGVPCSD